MKTKTIIVALLILVSIMLINCDPVYFKDTCHSYANIENNSNFSICTDFAENYPDTFLYDTNPLKRRGKAIEVGNTGKTMWKLSVCWENETSNIQYISIFIFDAGFMEDNLNDEDFIIDETMALQRYDLTLEDLNSLGWAIPYPPDERMRDMKMYPPYEE